MTALAEFTLYCNCDGFHCALVCEGDCVQTFHSGGASCRTVASVRSAAGAMGWQTSTDANPRSKDRCDLCVGER